MNFTTNNSNLYSFDVGFKFFGMIIFVSMGCAFIAWARNLSVWFPKKYAEMYKLGQSEDLPVIVVKIIGVLFIAIGFFGLFCPIGIPANR